MIKYATMDHTAKRRIRKSLYKIIKSHNGSIELDKLFTLIAKETGIFYNSSEILSCIVYNNSKFKVDCIGKVTIQYNI